MQARFTTLFAFCALTSAVFAQSLTSVGGTVTDPTGAVVPGATVILENIATGLQRQASSDAAGRYAFLQVQPGSYRILAKASGFRDVDISDLRLLVNSPATANIQFAKLGTVTEAVTVNAQAAQVNTVDASLGNAIGTNAILQIPLFARDVVALLALQPGVTYFGGGGENTFNGAINGGKSDQANVTMDGVDVNEQENRPAFTSVLRATLDSVQEFRSTTANANADMGRSSGAQIALVTKSGTNELHGSAYEYHRNTAGAANSFFNNMSGIPTPKLLINVFGTSVGGAVKKNRLFYFLNYEGRRDASAQSATHTVPSLNMRNGIVKYLMKDGTVGELTPTDLQTRVDPLGIGVDQKVLDVFNLYPAPNDNTVGDGLNSAGFRFATPIHSKQDTYISRWDYYIDNANKHTLFWRGNLQNDHAGGMPNFPGQPPASVSLNNSKGMAVGYNAVLRPNLITAFHYGLTREGWENTGVENQSMVGFRQFDSLYPTTTEQLERIPVNHWSEDLTWNRGAHTLQFGGTIRWTRLARWSTALSFDSAQTDSTDLIGTGVEFTQAVPDLDQKFRASYTDAVAAILGTVSYGSARYNYDKNGNVLPLGAPVYRQFASEEYETYGQDTWRISRGLVMTAGLRYSLMPPFHETQGMQISALPSLSDWMVERQTLAERGLPASNAGLISYVLAGGPQGKPLYPFHKKSFAPRFSLAYSPQGTDGWKHWLYGGPGQTSIRAGFGMFYDLFGSGLMVRTDERSPGFSNWVQSKAYFSASTAPRFNGIFTVDQLPPDLIRPAPKGGFPQTPQEGGGAQTTSVPDDHIKPPYSMNLNFSISREFRGGVFIQGSYVGRLSRRSLAIRDLALYTNLRDPKSGMTLFQAAQAIDKQVKADVPVDKVASIPYWENLWPGAASSGLTATQAIYKQFADYAPDWGADVFDLLDTSCDPSCSIYGPYALFSSQYYALGTWQSIGKGSYHAMQWTARKRFGHGIMFDFNYTWSKSIDLTSEPELSSLGYGSSLIINTWDPSQNRAVSGYDVTQMWNAGWVVELPFGKGRRFLGNAKRGVNGALGGWQLSGLWYQTTGLPASVSNGYAWPTNWNVNGWATQTGTVPTPRKTMNAPAIAGTPGPNMFADPKLALAAYDYTMPGESGQRNGLRGDGYMNWDMGLGKRFNMPYNEHHSLQFRWEVFNVFNTVRFGSPSLGFIDPGSFGKYTSQRTTPRQMQFALRYEF